MALTLPVSDIELAAVFYGTLLDQPGNRVAGDHHYFQCGATTIECRDDLGADSQPVDFAIAVADLDAAYDRACAAGCSELGDITTTATGRLFTLTDPFANHVRFEEHRG